MQTRVLSGWRCRLDTSWTFPIPVELPKWFLFLQIHFYNLIDEPRESYHLGVKDWNSEGLCGVGPWHHMWGCFAHVSFHPGSTGLPVQRDAFSGFTLLGGRGRVPRSLPPPHKTWQAKHRWACSLLSPKSRFSKCLVIQTKRREKKQPISSLKLQKASKQNPTIPPGK